MKNYSILNYYFLFFGMGKCIGFKWLKPQLPNDLKDKQILRLATAPFLRVCIAFIGLECGPAR
jgi:hypothetical protein